MGNLLYVGPSWAVTSFDASRPGYKIEPTSLFKELNLNAINLAKFSASNDDMVDAILNFNGPIIGIIWVYCEPLLNVCREDKVSVLNDPNFWNIRNKINDNILQRINDLNIPVGIIGAHSDIFNCDYSNIEIIHSSWQQFLGNISTMEVENGWGAEILHRWLVYEFPNSKISKEAVDMISVQFNTWTRLELNKLFYMTHPNRTGNILFANEIRSKINLFVSRLTQ